MIYFSPVLDSCIMQQLRHFYEQRGNIMRTIAAVVCVFCPLAERFACNIFCFQPKLTILMSYMMGKDVFTVWPLYAGDWDFLCHKHHLGGGPSAATHPFGGSIPAPAASGTRVPDIFPLLFYSVKRIVHQTKYIYHK